MSTITSSVPLLARKEASYPRITSGRIAMGDASREFDIESFDISGMDFACCISTGSWCCPSVDGLTVNGYGHRELGIDALNLKPVESMSAHRIHNNDLLITNDEVRAMHHEVEEGSNSASDYSCDQASKKTAHNEGLHNHNRNKDVHNPGVNNTGFSLKLLTTTHSSILTQGVQNV
jgi:hypothetical protein